MPAHLFVAARLRNLLARQPWIYWSAVIAIAVGAAFVVKSQLDGAEAARSSWEDTRPVLVARHDVDPDSPVVADTVELPVAAVPATAIDALPDGALAHRRIGAGEILVAADVVAAPGPARHATVGNVVVGLVDPLSPAAAIGLDVQVASDGVVLAAEATVVDVVGDVVFVEVRESDGPAVAAAAQAGRASLLFVP